MARIYYRGPAGVVTDTHFVRPPPDGRAFLLTDLRNVGITHRRSANYVPIVATTTVAVLAGAVFGLVVARPWGWATGAAVAVAALTAGLSLLSRNRLTYSLQAVYRGAETELYSTTDAPGFSQMCRALRRALEDSRLRHGPGHHT